MDNTVAVNTYDNIANGNGKLGNVNGGTLKLIALITMFIDHFGATIIESKLPTDATGEYAGSSGMFLLYLVLRLIGRIAFPLYIFLLVEGFKYTRNRMKYLLRLVVFSFASEIAFDMAFNKISINDIKHLKLIEFSYQNVFFTLALGFAALMCIDATGKALQNKLTKAAAIVVIAVIFALIAKYLKTDYDASGVMAIVVMYLLRDKPKLGISMTILALVFLTFSKMINFLELAALIDIWPISKYNGAKGKGNKWFFYIFYPAHLLILALITMAL